MDYLPLEGNTVYLFSLNHNYTQITQFYHIFIGMADEAILVRNRNSNLYNSTRYIKGFEPGRFNQNLV